VSSATAIIGKCAPFETVWLVRRSPQLLLAEIYITAASRTYLTELAVRGTTVTQIVLRYVITTLLTVRYAMASSSTLCFVYIDDSALNLIQFR